MVEKFDAEASVAFVAGSPNADAEGPQGATMTVFAAGVFEPLSAMAHEVAEAPGFVVEGGREEGEVAGDELIEVLFGGLAAEFVEKVAEDEGAGVVIDAIPFMEIGDVERGVLEDAGAVAHANDVVESQWREVIGSTGQCPTGEGGAGGGFAIDAGVLKGVEITLGNGGPDHFASELISVMAGAVESLGIVEISADAIGDRGRIAERHESAAVIGEQFGGVPVRRGDNRFAGTKHIGEGAGGDLRFVEIGGEIDVGGTDELGEIIERNETVVEDYVLFDATFFGESFEAESISFAFPGDEMRMGGTEDEIDDVGMTFDDGWERFNGIFNAFAGSKQAKSEQHHAAFNTELSFEKTGVVERNVGDAVGDDVDLGVGNGIGVAQDVGTFAGHDHEAIAALHQFLHHLALGRIRGLQDGVQGGDHGHAHLLEQGEKMATCRSAVDAEFMLDAEDVGVVEVEKIGGAAVGVQIFFEHLEAHSRWILVTFELVVDGTCKTLGSGDRVADRFTQIMREGGNAAAPRLVTPDKSNAPQWRNHTQDCPLVGDMVFMVNKTPVMRDSKG